MVTVTTNADRSNEVTTVQVVVTNTYSTPQVVSLRNRLDGAVWPSRRNGVVDPRWNGDGWEVMVRPGRSRGVGFASPEPPADPPVEIVSADRCDPEVPTGSPSDVLADLDAWSPTRAVLERGP